MADPIAYDVTVNRPFIWKPLDMVFIPAERNGPKAGFPRYQVTPDVYNGTLEDGTPFAQLCATADPVFPPSP